MIVDTGDLQAAYMAYSEAVTAAVFKSLAPTVSWEITRRPMRLYGCYDAAKIAVTEMHAITRLQDAPQPLAVRSGPLT